MIKTVACGDKQSDLGMVQAQTMSKLVKITLERIRRIK
jgi:hypothetical protein